MATDVNAARAALEWAHDRRDIGQLDWILEGLLALEELISEGLEWSAPCAAADHELDSLEAWQERVREALGPVSVTPPDQAGGA